MTIIIRKALNRKNYYEPKKEVTKTAPQTGQSGAFSGKDATKVDRSAAYLARYIAVHTLTRPQYRYANECIVKVAYAIGIAEPLDITILVDGVECKVSSIHKQMLKPKEIIDFLHLREPVYESTARDGHFGVGQRWG